MVTEIPAIDFSPLHFTGARENSHLFLLCCAPLHFDSCSLIRREIHVPAYNYNVVLIAESPIRFVQNARRSLPRKKAREIQRHKVTEADRQRRKDMREGGERERMKGRKKIRWRKMNMCSIYCASSWLRVCSVARYTPVSPSGHAWSGAKMGH